MLQEAAWCWWEPWASGEQLGGLCGCRKGGTLTSPPQKKSISWVPNAVPGQERLLRLGNITKLQAYSHSCFNKSKKTSQMMLCL